MAEKGGASTVTSRQITAPYNAIELLNLVEILYWQQIAGRYRKGKRLALSFLIRLQARQPGGRDCINLGYASGRRIDSAHRRAVRGLS